MKIHGKSSSKKTTTILFVALLAAGIIIPLSPATAQGVAPVPSCSFQGNYGSCAFYCPAGAMILLTAEGSGYPLTSVSCGGVNDYCQSATRCSKLVGPTSSAGWGTCQSETVRNTGSCTATCTNAATIASCTTTSAPLPNPRPRTATGPGGSIIVYDDKDNDGAVDPGEEIARTPNARTRDNPDGTCTAWNDANGNDVPDSSETPQTFPCPAPRTQPAPGGQTTIYDDKDNDGAMDPGEHIVTSPNVKQVRNGNGTCTAYNDADNDGIVDAGEAYGGPFPCPNPKTRSGPGGTTIIYDDKDNDGTEDPGEQIARTPNAKTVRKGDGNCAAYDDRNANGAMDAGETLVTYPCPNPAVTPGPSGSFFVYDDRDNDGTQDANEPTLHQTPMILDSDDDNLPDEAEARACSRRDVIELVNLLFENGGECSEDGRDYTPPSDYRVIQLPIMTTRGPDADRDGFPTEVRIQRLKIVIAPFQAGIAWAEPGDDLIIPIDAADADPNTPAQRIFTVPAPLVVSHELGPDSDQDGVFSQLVLHRKTFVFDSRDGSLQQLPASDQVEPLDPNDADPNVPVQSVFGPVRVPTAADGTDADGDRLPGSVRVTYLTLTFDRRPGHGLSQGTDSSTFFLDADDGDRGAPVPFDAFDGDADDIPDAIEPQICSIEDFNDPADGECFDNANDYRPPMGVPNPWTVI